jgi:hypothetical protein
MIVIHTRTARIDMNTHNIRDFISNEIQDLQHEINELDGLEENGQTFSFLPGMRKQLDELWKAEMAISKAIQIREGAPSPFVSSPSLISDD